MAIIARIKTESAQEQSRAELKKAPLNIVLIGQKIVAKVMDDPYVEMCGNACAKKLGVTAQKVSTGHDYISALVEATSNEELSACVFWGHSWAIGLYLQDNQGLYLDKIYNSSASILPVGARKLSHIRKSSIKTKPHSLFIFASCGTATDSDRTKKGYNDNSFAANFGKYINKLNSGTVEEGVSHYKVTVIGATDLSNLLQDGTVKTDGVFMKIETLFKIEKRAVYKEVEEGMLWWKKKHKTFEEWKESVTIVNSNETSLGKKIDPAEIIKKHNPNETNI